MQAWANCFLLQPQLGQHDKDMHPLLRHRGQTACSAPLHRLVGNGSYIHFRCCLTGAQKLWWLTTHRRGMMTLGSGILLEVQDFKSFLRAESGGACL